MKEQGTAWSAEQLTELLSYAGTCVRDTALLQFWRDEGANWPYSLLHFPWHFGMHSYRWLEPSIEWARARGCTSYLPALVESLSASSDSSDSESHLCYHSEDVLSDASTVTCPQVIFRTAMQVLMMGVLFDLTATQMMRSQSIVATVMMLMLMMMMVTAVAVKLTKLSEHIGRLHAVGNH